ncbi:MAG: anthranilate synthase component I family protein [Mariprofundaceae bacterium]|nr:anthranilate synthase component I family protein [Mariprofundaceae bacterium]
MLEDPKGSGRQFVVSTAGQSYVLDDVAAAPKFFAAWQADLQDVHSNKQTNNQANKQTTPSQVDVASAFPTIKHLFYVAYETAAVFESLPAPKTKADGGLIWRHQPQWCVCFDVDADTVYLSSTASVAELDMLQEMLDISSGITADTAGKPLQIPSPHIVQEDYTQAVEQVKHYIRQGDVFQVNIARFWQTKCNKEDVNALYTKLRSVNPAPFACFVQAGDLTIICASPERLFSISAQGKVSTRPIAGTRKRSEGEHDDALSAELLLSEKERAEHIMLLDLERNDLGRVCVPGSIVVDECMLIEKYATVQHIVSNVSGQLDSQYDMLDVLKAMFPGGTITGCPKVRCMEIIHELEPKARGPYTGGVGYMAWDGSVDMNILIRSFWHWQGTLNWAAGAGIVADSVPEHEELETEHKVAGLMRVFE